MSLLRPTYIYFTFCINFFFPLNLFFFNFIFLIQFFFSSFCNLHIVLNNTFAIFTWWKRRISVFCFLSQLIKKSWSAKQCGDSIGMNFRCKVILFSRNNLNIFQFLFYILTIHTFSVHISIQIFMQMYCLMLV